LSGPGAVAAFDRAIVADPDFALAHVGRARTLQLSADIPGAKARRYQQALALNPRHRSGHEHLGEAYLVQGEPAKAEEHLTALERICLIPCDEYDDLKQAIAEYDKVAKR
jgi:Tfp pilus assembly protein PilF